jgi:hypothetical protein
MEESLEEFQHFVQSANWKDRKLERTYLNASWNELDPPWWTKQMTRPLSRTDNGSTDSHSTIITLPLAISREIASSESCAESFCWGLLFSFACEMVKPPDFLIFHSTWISWYWSSTIFKPAANSRVIASSIRTIDPRLIKIVGPPSSHDCSSGSAFDSGGAGRRIGPQGVTFDGTQKGYSLWVVDGRR